MADAIAVPRSERIAMRHVERRFRRAGEIDTRPKAARQRSPVLRTLYFLLRSTVLTVVQA